MEALCHYVHAANVSSVEEVQILRIDWKGVMKIVVQVSAFVTLLAVTTIFGFMGRPTEMAISIVAAAMALAFSDIERFKKIKGAGFEAETREQILSIIEKETEPAEASDSEDTSPLTAEIDADLRAIMRALNHHEYTWRYLSGIVLDSEVDKNTVLAKLKWLVEYGFARQSIGKHGPIWSLTELGRHREVIDDFKNLGGQ